MQKAKGKVAGEWWEAEAGDVIRLVSERDGDFDKCYIEAIPHSDGSFEIRSVPGHIIVFPHVANVVRVAHLTPWDEIRSKRDDTDTETA